MRLPNTTILLFLFLYTIGHSHAQHLPDSLVSKCNDARTDADKGRCIIYSIPDSAFTINMALKLHEYFMERNDQVGIDYAKVFVNMNLNARGDFTTSLKESLEILSRFKNREDRYGEMWALHVIADAYGEAKNFDTALGYLKKEMWIAQSLNDTDRYINVMNDIGYTYYEANMPDSGLVYSTNLTKLCRENNYTGLLPYALSTLSENYIAKKEYKTALPLLKECLAYIRSDSLVLASVLYDLSECFGGLNVMDSVIYYSSMSMEIAKK